MKAKTIQRRVSYQDVFSNTSEDERSSSQEVEELPKREIETQKDQDFPIPALDPNISRAIKTSSKKPYEDSDVKTIPEGFKEITPSKDFRILTPHDEDHVKDLLQNSEESDLFRPQKNEEANLEKSSQDVKIELDKTSDAGETICFACGHGNPPESEKCKNCGTDL